MPKRRFFCESPINAASVYVLEGSEHQHLTKVLRAQVGDEVALFDGTGIECLAIVKDISRRETQLTIQSHELVDRELPNSVTLAVALPKGERQQWVIEKAVELGITALLPLVTEYGVAQPKGKTQQRMERQIINASKQCGRNKLMQLLEPQSFADTLSFGEPNTQSNTLRVIAHPGGVPVAEVAQDQASTPLLLMVGPEGGFSTNEIELAKEATCTIVSLGDRILRIETAAVALASRFIYA